MTNFNFREIESHYHAGVFFRRGVSAYVCVAEEEVEFIGSVDVVVAFENGAPESFAEAARTQKHRRRIVLKQFDVFRLVNEIVVLLFYLFVISDSVWNSFSAFVRHDQLRFLF